MRKSLMALLGLGLCLLGIGWQANVGPAHAQAQLQAEADLYPADASAFPTVSAFMDVFDASGRFVSGLKPADVTILEDSQPVQVQELNEMVVPLELAVAVNSGPALGVRNTQGIPRFQGIAQALGSWAQALPPVTPDDMSLVSISGPIILHANPRDWAVSLGSFQPDFHATTPNLQSLQIAIDTVGGQTPRVGMKRAVLFITPHMDDPNIDTMVAPLIQLAVQHQVRVFVWFTDTEVYEATTSAAAFSTLAAQTGGMYFSATATPAVYPNPDSYFAPLRRIYALKYKSAVTKGGPHTLSVTVKSQAGDIKSAEQQFNVDLQPPNPILVSPPLQIVRQPPADDPYNQKILLPTSQEIDIIIEFPDGHKRPLTRTTLYVDGMVAAENKAPPFDRFTWDLSGYTVSGDHKMLIEAVDNLNLSKTSMEVPITVTVIQPPHGLSAIFGRYRQDITIGAVGFAGIVLLAILFMGIFRTTFVRLRSSRQAQADPVTQSVAAGIDEPTPVIEKKKRRGGRSAATSTKTQSVEAPAQLRRLIADPLAAPGQTFKPAPVSPIPLLENEITFGTDPVQSTYVLDDPSVASKHARISRTEAGEYVIADEGTIAGTWVNFEPVGTEGHSLQHGDVVHFGQLVFRFELKDAPAAAEPKIEKENPDA